MAELQEGATVKPDASTSKLKALDKLLQAALKRDEKLHVSGVSGIIKYAQHIQQTQNELGSGSSEWNIFQSKMKASPSDVSKYVTIAENPYLTNSENWGKLPSSFSTLYILAAWMAKDEHTQEDWEDMIDGDQPQIHSRLTRNDALRLTGKTIKTTVEKKADKEAKNEEIKKATDEEHLKAGEALEATKQETPQVITLKSNSVAEEVATEPAEPTAEAIAEASDPQDLEDAKDIQVYQQCMEGYQELQLKKVVKNFLKSSGVQYHSVEIRIN